MRLYGHIKRAGDSETLCGKPVPPDLSKGPALFFCGKCVNVLVSKKNTTTFKWSRKDEE